MAGLGPYNQLQINGNFVLTELQRKNFEIAEVSNELVSLDERVNTNRNVASGEYQFLDNKIDNQADTIDNQIDTQVLRLDERIDTNRNTTNNQIIFLDGKIDNKVERLAERMDGSGLRRGFTPSLGANIVLAGDSWFTGSSADFGEKLVAKMGKNPVKSGFSGRCITNLLTAPYGFVNDIVKNTAYNNYSSLINYGINDIKLGGIQFNQNPYQYQNCSLASYITCACPQAKIIDTRNFATKSGDVINFSGNYSFGVRWTEADAYIETPVTARYMALCFYLSPTAASPEILVDGNLVSARQVKYFEPDDGQPYDYYVQTILVDMGNVNTRTVRVRTQYIVEDRTTCFPNYLCCWDGDEETMRDVLVLSPPIFDWRTRGDASVYLIYKTVIDSQKAAVKACQNAGLKVFLHVPVSADHLMTSDNLHLTERGAQLYSDEIMRDSVFLNI